MGRMHVLPRKKLHQYVIFLLVTVLAALWQLSPFEALAVQQPIFQTSFDTASDMNSFSVGDLNSQAGLDYWGFANWAGAAWCAAVGQSGTAGPPNTTLRKYDNSMTAYMDKVIDLTGKTNAALEFWYKLPSADPEDNGKFYATYDAGQLRINNNIHLPFLDQLIPAGWVQHSADLTPYAGAPVTLQWLWYSDVDGTGEGLYIDDIVVTSDPPPASVSNLASTKRTGNSVTLSWTAPGEDWNTGTGTAAEYDVRYSTSPITDSTWASATQPTGEPTPQVPGTSQSFTVRNLSSQTTYYFAMKTRDQIANNWSALSNAPSVMTSIAGDINGDGRVGLTDLAMLAAAYGSRSGDAKYNPDADLNNDGRVGLTDLAILAANYGKVL